LAGRTGTALGILEKDQAITLVLTALSLEPAAKHLVFKGATALSKVYFSGYRFSADLDFTASQDIVSELLQAEPRIIEAGRRVGVRVTRLERVPTGRSGRTLKVRYADMNGHSNHILVQMSLREPVRLPAKSRAVVDPYGVASRDARIPTMDLREIAAEKIRSLLMRSQARDLYDLWFLLRTGVAVDEDLVGQKLDWWKRGLSYDPDEVIARLGRIEVTWRRDLGPLLIELPPFQRVAEDVTVRLGGVRRRRGAGGRSALM
jgi:hypothetical protein